jgi:hypothetical protein
MCLFVPYTFSHHFTYFGEIGMMVEYFHGEVSETLKFQFLFHYPLKILEIARIFYFCLLLDNHSF